MENELKGVNPVLMAFLNEEDFDKKYDLLLRRANEIDDTAISSMAASLDVVIEQGDLATRLDQLKHCVKVRGKYESMRPR